jgi:hypothetical protein
MSIDNDFIENYDFEHPNTQLLPANLVNQDYFCFLKNKNENEDLYEKINHNTLFTSLLSKTINNDNNMCNKFFDLPDLPNNVDNYFWQIPINKDYEWINYNDLVNIDGYTLKPKVSS